MLHAKYIPFNAPLMQHYAFISCFKHASKMHIHAMLDAHAQDKNSFTLDMRLYVCRKALILCKDTLQTITSLSCSLQKWANIPGVETSSVFNKTDNAFLLSFCYFFQNIYANELRDHMQSTETQRNKNELCRQWKWCIHIVSVR